jgi:hypothetical protein
MNPSKGDNMNIKPGWAIAVSAALLSMILTSVTAQEEARTAQPPEPAPAHAAIQFPAVAMSKSTESAGGKTRRREAVWLKTVFGYRGDYTDIRNYYQGVYVCTSSAGAPQFEFGDNAAEAIATLIEQGYTLQGSPQSDEYGFAASLLFLK